MSPAWHIILPPLLWRLGVARLDDTLHPLTARAEPPVGTPPGKVRVLVLARQHYFETKRSYPVRNRRELAAVIALDGPELSPWPDATLLYHVANAQPGKMMVNIWCLHPQLLTRHHLQPWLILPEGLLHALASSEPLQQLPGAAAPWYLYRDKQGRLTSQSASGPYHSPALFCELVGAEPSQLQTRSPEEHLAQLRRGLALLEPAHLPGLWVARGTMPEPRRLLRLALLLVTLGGGYLAASSYWLYSQASRLQQQGASMRESLEQQMSQEQQLHALAEHHRALATPLQQVQANWRLLSLLVEVFDSPEQFERLNLSGQRVELHATVPSASALLARLSERPEVSGAHFAGPVQSATRGGNERAILVFDLRLAPGAEGEHAH